MAATSIAMGGSLAVKQQIRPRMSARVKRHVFGLLEWKRVLGSILGNERSDQRALNLPNERTTSGKWLIMIDC